MLQPQIDSTDLLSELLYLDEAKKASCPIYNWLKKWVVASVKKLSKHLLLLTIPAILLTILIIPAIPFIIFTCLIETFCFRIKNFIINRKIAKVAVKIKVEDLESSNLSENKQLLPYLAEYIDAKTFGHYLIHLLFNEVKIDLLVALRNVRFL